MSDSITLGEVLEHYESVCNELQAEIDRLKAENERLKREPIIVHPEVVVDIGKKAIDDFIPYLQGRIAMFAPVEILKEFDSVGEDFKSKVIDQALANKEKE